MKNSLKLSLISWTRRGRRRKKQIKNRPESCVFSRLNQMQREKNLKKMSKFLLPHTNTHVVEQVSIIFAFFWRSQRFPPAAVYYRVVKIKSNPNHHHHHHKKERVRRRGGNSWLLLCVLFEREVCASLLFFFLFFLNDTHKLVKGWEGGEFAISRLNMRSACVLSSSLPRSLSCSLSLAGGLVTLFGGAFNGHTHTLTAIRVLGSALIVCANFLATRNKTLPLPSTRPRPPIEQPFSPCTQQNSNPTKTLALWRSRAASRLPKMY